ncbi:MAG TPA: hypothetical protein VK646_04390 [Actinomycetota bacterium]|nr:hypothetical protein [Actinomycetota bacterium]
MSERFCLRCDWTGPGEGASCPECGAPLYRLEAPTLRPPVAAPDPAPTPDQPRLLDVPSDREPVVAPARSSARPRWTAAAVVGVIAMLGAGVGVIALGPGRPEGAEAASPSASSRSATAPSASRTAPTESVGDPNAGPESCLPSTIPPPPSSQLAPGWSVSADLIADYRFQDSLRSSVGDAPTLVQAGGTGGFTSEVVGGERRTVLRFDGGAGLSISPVPRALRRGPYTIELLFRLEQVGGFRKLVDFDGGTRDAGLYDLDGCLNLFPKVTGRPAGMRQDFYAHVVLTRDRNGAVVGYLDGIRRFAFEDRNGLALVHGNVLRLFMDDLRTRREYSGGAVARVRLFDRALAADEVTALACASLGETTCGAPG